MSTGNKKTNRTAKKANEKDKRMAQLEKEIARLEHENNKLKRDSVEYQNRLAAFGGATRFGNDFPTLNRVLHTVENNRVPFKPDKNFANTLRPESIEANETRKRKLRDTTMKSSKKAKAKK